MIFLHELKIDTFSFSVLRDEIEELFGVSNISAENLKDEKVEPHNTRTYKTSESEKKQTDVFPILLMRYAR